MARFPVVARWHVGCHANDVNAARATVGGKQGLKKARKEDVMLMTIAAILVVLWLLGLVSSYTLGGFIHVLLVVAIIIVLVRVIQGRTPL